MVLVTHHHYHRLGRTGEDDDHDDDDEEVCHTSCRSNGSSTSSNFYNGVVGGGGSGDGISRKHAKKVSPSFWILCLLLSLIYQTSGQSFGFHYPFQTMHSKFIMIIITPFFISQKPTCHKISAPDLQTDRSVPFPPDF